jgi:predicted secreted acid phosphatase
MIVVVDIDGTVADNSHREGFIQGSKKDWDAFYHPAFMEKDAVIQGAKVGLSKLMTNRRTKLVFLTGRPERTRLVTHRWLDVNLGLLMTQEEVLMRSDTDRRKAHDYKRDQATRLYAKNHKEHSFIFIDDDPQTYEMFWGFGVVLQAPECWSVLP